MVNTKDLDIRYVVDDTGQRRSVLLSIEQFERLMEEIEDLAAVAGRRDEPTIPHEQVLAELRRDGLLD